VTDSNDTSQKLPSEKEHHQMNSEWRDDDGLSVASTQVPMNIMKRKTNNIIDQILLNNSNEGSDKEEEVITTTTIQPPPRLVSSCEQQQHFEESLRVKELKKKIEKLTEMYTSLSNKIAPSPLLTSADSEMEGKRILHLCIRSLIQSLASMESVLQWIVENINIIGDGHQNDEQLLPNSWFWNTILKYEAANDKVSELKNFETNLKQLCLRNHTQTVVGKEHVVNLFIPPPPQTILDLIIREHNNNLLIMNVVKEEGEAEEKLSSRSSRLPFKKINLIPPENTKPFQRVRFRKWRPEEESNNSNDGDKIVGGGEEKILLTEFTWDRDKLKYVHMQWPQYKKEVILKNYQGNDYEMIGVIFGRQFIGDWRLNELLPQLGLKKYPTSYIFATKRSGSLGYDYSAGIYNQKWYLCPDDNYKSSSRPLLYHNFKDVLLHISHVKTFCTQLAIFRLLKRMSPTTSNKSNDRGSDGEAHLNKILHPRFTADYSQHSREEEESSSSDAEDSGDEPLLKKGQTISAAASRDCWNVVGNVKSFVLKETWAPKKKKKIKFIPPPPLNKHQDSHKKYPKTESILKNKKSVMETLATLCSPTATTASTTEEENKYFCYHRSSEYSIGPRGRLNQTEDLKRYFKQKQPLFL
jgi:hypothetical protein